MLIDKKMKKIIILLGAIVIAFIILIQSVYTIETGYVGIKSTFGKYDKNIIKPGIHFKIPFIQKIQRFDVKMQSANYKGKQDLPDGSGVVNKPMINVLDVKNLPIGIELTVMYTPIENEASTILGKYGTNSFDKLINPIIRDVIRDVIGNYQAEKIAKDRTEIAIKLKHQLSKKFKGTGFKLTEVSLRNIELPILVKKKIEEVQLAKQEEQKLAMVEQQAVKQQKIKTIEAKTKLIEVTTKAKSNAAKRKINADAEAYSVLKEAEAQAKANKLISNSITNELINYKKINKWNGKYPQTYLGDSSNKNLLLKIN